MSPTNKTLLQYFEWYLRPQDKLWHKLAKDAPRLAKMGFTDIWLPPAYKGAGGINDVGYGVYDLYDLGEFDQKGSVPTKYGSKGEYLTAIQSLHEHNLNAIADIVLNQRIGADYAEEVRAEAVAEDNRTEPIEAPETISAWTGFNFPGRHDQYSAFHWNHNHFAGTDWDNTTNRNEVFQLTGKHWERDIDLEKGNYDYLAGADVDVSNPEVIAELDRWGQWYLETTGVDGFRLDGVKHIGFTFFTHWLENLRRATGRPLWTVGEYWQGDVAALTNYLDESGDIMNLFDVPLHYNFQQASKKGSAYDLRRIFDGTLVGTRPERAVTFVDNHDTEPGQSLESWVDGWFKPLAYALILLRNAGTPCAFYGDLYGVPHEQINPVGDRLPLLVQARATRAHGEQVDYFDDKNLIGWTRLGDAAHPGSGLAVVMSNASAGEKEMSMGVNFTQQTFIDILGNHPGEVTLNDSGRGTFPCQPGSVSVWVPKSTVSAPNRPQSIDKKP